MGGRERQALRKKMKWGRNPLMPPRAFIGVGQVGVVGVVGGGFGSFTPTIPAQPTVIGNVPNHVGHYRKESGGDSDLTRRRRRDKDSIRGVTSWPKAQDGEVSCAPRQPDAPIRSRLPFHQQVGNFRNSYKNQIRKKQRGVRLESSRTSKPERRSRMDENSQPAPRELCGKIKRDQ
jgi:hypothetical protein